MRNPLAAGFLLCVFSILPAAAATCPGTIVLQDLFTSQTPAWDATVYSQTKFLIQGGKAEVSIIQPGYSRVEEYWGARYGDVNLCITVASPATDKSEGQVGGLVFWATDYNSYYSLMVNPANGQFAVTQKLPSGQWAFPVAWAANPAVVQGFGKANALRVQTRGKTATLFINDQQVGSFIGTPPAGGGQVGFYAESEKSATSTDSFDFTDFAVAATQSATPLPSSAACPGTVVFQDQFPNGDTFLNIQTAAQAQVTAQDGKGEIIINQGNYGQSAQYTGNQYGDASFCATFNTLPTDKPENQLRRIRVLGNRLHRLLYIPHQSRQRTISDCPELRWKLVLCPHIGAQQPCRCSGHGKSKRAPGANQGQHSLALHQQSTGRRTLRHCTSRRGCCRILCPIG